ncbi:hypothetical protein Y032_0068g251 [Ancylostoma ceylanicum]|uniref:Uncharacterized protein n=1 Tax=Ancylostoma ceylanicum TaxID=53326 RepID=A0A016TY87_9BILA|nr:hypothetical protein Y032_0068g251 [Ancylostoma ceylanicum]
MSHLRTPLHQIHVIANQLELAPLPSRKKPPKAHHLLPASDSQRAEQSGQRPSSTARCISSSLRTGTSPCRSDRNRKNRRTVQDDGGATVTSLELSKFILTNAPGDKRSTPLTLRTAATAKMT